MEKKRVVHRRRFDSQFKLEAVNQVNNGRSVPDVAKALGISDSLLYGWFKRQMAGNPAVVHVKTDELEYLRRQVKQLETERDILKKALAIFSRVN